MPLPSRFPPSALLLGVALTSCYSDFESFRDKAANLICKGIRACEDGLAGAGYDSMEDCEASQIDLLEHHYGTCDYFEDEGRACIRALRRRKNACYGGAKSFTDVCDVDRVFDGCSPTWVGEGE